MRQPKRFLTFVAAICVLVPTTVLASSHREAPISALDHSADVTDWYAFVSYDHPDRVTMILNVDGFLEPSNGPNYFPFDPNVLYEMKVDNDQDGDDDIVQGIVQMRRGEQSLPMIRRVEAETDYINRSGILPPSVHIDRIYDRRDLISVTTRTCSSGGAAAGTVRSTIDRATNRSTSGRASSGRMTSAGIR